VDSIEIGRIARAHGVRGWVKAHVYWSGSDALLEVGSVLVAAKGEPAAWRDIEEARRADRTVLLKLAGVNDRDAAEALRGATLALERSQLPPLEDGEYYLCDLVGAKVIVAGSLYGEVVEVRTHPTLDSIVIRTSDGKLVEQPLTEPWLESVDAGAGEVTLANLDGVIA
jgi:16S rRNA processing protein RimM